MGYRIEYQPVRKIRRAEKTRSYVAAMTAACLLLFCILVHLLWPQGAEVLGKLIFSGDSATAVDALAHFVVELEAGEELQSAFETFCRTVIQNGEKNIQ